MSDISETINDILKKHLISASITDEHIVVTDKIVTDSGKHNSYLSNCIIENLWPRIPSTEVYHFTSREAAENILSTQTFRLQNIEKRFGEGEISTFCETHNLTGYLQKDVNNLPVYKTLLMPNTFYASFTETNLTEDEQEVLWRRFAANDGVRLTLRVTASNPDFRRMKYEQKHRQPIPVLRDLSSALLQQHNRHFMLSGISRVCAFYLPESSYGREKELRMLYKTWESIGPQPVGNGSTSYVELPLGNMGDDGYKLEVIGVSSRTKPAMPDSIRFTPRIVS
jgi:hypothetical protein